MKGQVQAVPQAVEARAVAPVVRVAEVPAVVQVAREGDLPVRVDEAEIFILQSVEMA